MTIAHLVDISWVADEDINGVVKTNLVLVIQKNLSIWKQTVFYLLLQRRGLEFAIRYLLGEISYRIKSGEISFAEGAEFCNMLVLSQDFTDELTHVEVYTKEG